MELRNGTLPSSGSQAPGSSDRMYPFSTSTSPGRPIPMPATRRPRRSASVSMCSMSDVIESTASLPAADTWALASTLPSPGWTSPAEIVEAPTSTPMTGSVRGAMRSPKGKQCASEKTLRKRTDSRAERKLSLRDPRRPAASPRPGGAGDPQGEIAGPDGPRARSRCAFRSWSCLRPPRPGAIPQRVRCQVAEIKRAPRRPGRAGTALAATTRSITPTRHEEDRPCFD